MYNKLMDIIEKIKEEKIVAVVRFSGNQDIFEIINALIDGGINLIEVTIENEENFEIIKKFQGHKSVNIIAGGIITTRQAQRAIDCGVNLIVSPVFQMSLVKFCKNAKIAHISTATTANEAYTAWKANVPIIKIYPTHNLGGVDYIEDILRPIPFINVMPSGSIQLNEVKEYIKSGITALCIGRALYNNADYNEIYNRAVFVRNEINYAK